MERYASKFGRYRSLWLMGLLVSILTMGCLSPKKREDITFRYLRENPKVLADLSALHYPVIAKPGQPVIVRDTVTEVERDTVRVDSIVYLTETQWRTVRVTERIVDTIPDNARIESLRLENVNIREAMIRKEVELEKEKEKSHARRWWAIGSCAALGIVLLLIGYNFFRPKLSGLWKELQMPK